MDQAKKRHSRCETLVGLAILLVLAGIAVGVFLKQFRYDPAIFAAGTPAGAVAVQSGDLGGALVLTAFSSGDMVALGVQERFDPEDLSDKINGKAETYLSAGFVELHCQRFSSRDDAQMFVEVFAYDMHRPSNAYTVYSSQMRSDVELLDLADFAYRTENALFFAHGQYYVEIIAGTDKTDMAQAIRSFSQLAGPMLAFARSFVKNVPADTEVMEELALFPDEGLRKGGVTRTSADQFGVPGFGSVFHALYIVEGKEATAFLAKQDSPSQAAGLVAAYCDYFRKFGGKELTPAVDIPGARMLEVDGIFKLVFARGNLVAGVDQSLSKAAAETVAALLYRNLAEAGQ